MKHNPRGGLRCILFLTCLLSVLSIAHGACGDGVVDGAEACDDGNTQSYDGCSSSCALENTNIWLCTGTALGESTGCCRKLIHPITQEPVCTCEGMEQPSPTLGFYISKDCQRKDINECDTDRGGCHKNAQCINYDAVANCLSTYECRCPPGLHGNGRTTCSMNSYKTKFKLIVPEASMTQEEIKFELRQSGVIPAWVNDEDVEIVFSTVYAPISANRRLLQSTGTQAVTQAEVVISSDSEESMANVTQSIDTSSIPADYTLTEPATTLTSSGSASVLPTDSPGFEVLSVSYDDGPSQWVVEINFNPGMSNTLVSPFLSKVGTAQGPYTTEALNTFKVSEFPCLSNTSVCCLSDYVDKYTVGSFQTTVDSVINDCVDPVIKTSNTNQLFDIPAISLSALSTLFENFPASSVEFPTASTMIMRIFADDITNSFSTRTDRLDGTYELEFSIGMAFFTLLPSPDISTSVSQTTITINVSPTMTFAFSSDTQYHFIDYLTVSLMQTKLIDAELMLRKMQFVRVGILLPDDFRQNMDTGLVPLSSIRFAISQTFPDRLDQSLWTNPCFASDGSGLYDNAALRQLYTDADDQTCGFHYDLCVNPVQEVLLTRLNHFAFPISNDTLSTAMLSEGYRLFITFDISAKDADGNVQISSVFSESTIKATSITTACDSIDAEMTLDSLVSVNVSFGLVGTLGDWDKSVTTVEDLMNRDQFAQNNSVDLGTNHNSFATSMLTLCASARPTLQDNRVAEDYYLNLDYLTSIHFLDSARYDIVNAMMKEKTETGTAAYTISVDEATGYHSISFTNEVTTECFNADDPTFSCGIKTSVSEGVVLEASHVQPLHHPNRSANDYDPPRWIANYMLNENEFSLELGTNMTSLVRSQFAIDNHMRSAWYLNPGYDWPRASVGTTLEAALAMSDKVIFIAVVSLRETATGRVTARRLLSINSDGEQGDEDIEAVMGGDDVDTDETVTEADGSDADSGVVSGNDKNSDAIFEDNGVGDVDSNDLSHGSEGEDGFPASTNRRRLLQAKSVLPDIQNKPIENTLPGFEFNINVGSVISELLAIASTDRWAYLNFQGNVDVTGKDISTVGRDIRRAIAARGSEICPICSKFNVTAVTVPPPSLSIASRRLLATSSVNIKVMAAGIDDSVPYTTTPEKIVAALANAGFTASNVERSVVERSEGEVTTPSPTTPPPARRYDGCGWRCWGQSPSEGIVAVFFVLISIFIVIISVRAISGWRAGPVTEQHTVPMANIVRQEETKQENRAKSMFYLPSLEQRHRGQSHHRV